MKLAVIRRAVWYAGYEYEFLSQTFGFLLLAYWSHLNSDLTIELWELG